MCTCAQIPITAVAIKIMLNFNVALWQLPAFMDQVFLPKHTACPCGHDTWAAPSHASCSVTEDIIPSVDRLAMSIKEFPFLPEGPT